MRVPQLLLWHLCVLVEDFHPILIVFHLMVTCKLSHKPTWFWRGWSVVVSSWVAVAGALCGPRATTSWTLPAACCRMWIASWWEIPESSTWPSMARIWSPSCSLPSLQIYKSSKTVNTQYYHLNRNDRTDNHCKDDRQQSQSRPPHELYIILIHPGYLWVFQLEPC